MLIIIDEKIPSEAKEKLSGCGELLELSTQGLTYPAISGHPDIFFCKTPTELIVAPNLPANYFSILDKNNVNYKVGNNRISSEVAKWRNSENGLYHKKHQPHHSAFIHYNAAVSEEYLVHRLEYTDPVILEQCHYLKKIAVKQGYTRCNLLFFGKDQYITSDRGIQKALQQHLLNGLLVTSEGIVLPGFPNGFIGGTMGLFENKVFILGSLENYSDGLRVRKLLKQSDFEIIELFHGSLFDGGSILFI